MIIQQVKFIIILFYFQHKIKKKENYKQIFINNLNNPFGFAPYKRLKLIHGYDSFIENSTLDENEDYITLPFVLSEDLFIEFEQNIIVKQIYKYVCFFQKKQNKGNGESEKEQIVKEFEHIHNKAIFDTFNEALNIFRPFYTLGGQPYLWSTSEKNLLFKKINENDLFQIIDKSNCKVIEWSTSLCGLINEEEISRNIPHQDENGKPPSLHVLLENITSSNEYLAQVREEKLSKMLLTEIFENEYRWQLYEDEKAEVTMELSDLVFEEIIENIIYELQNTL
ncbi:IQ calmodulin-binding motif family protein, putative [Ichthyophthirius multifiliis]|uniref:IQ calmodulin-binding motif family protein, putative n=1 Tax=Ichthyophthirius multifiliis TaxID=5932 RepID=G0R0G4_ICHMU|nr:IQ calmodulin-binding motif family protein, putative [Ichthyophthirius multifiliis]EGR29043.1 IQ calmodulin-binding motif family protein, putative [Ichthyophthirius multifiliis]|eukprot:XP_004030279.1 IQ calmodulin-binding motif family protein, putative [Ichthyophthirius multifiliis]